MAWYGLGGLVLGLLERIAPTGTWLEQYANSSTVYFLSRRRREGLAMKARQSPGFAFTEVLACIPCVVLLIALLFPAVKTAREKAREARCKQNMRNMVNAIFIFATEHEGHFPAAGKCSRNGEFDWTWGGNIMPLPQTDPAKCERVRVEEGVLWPYVMGMPRVGPYGRGRKMRDKWYASPKTNPYLCPSAGPVGRKRGLSYSMNGYLEVSADGGAVTGIKLSKIRNQSTTVLLVDESELTLNDGYFDPAGDENKSPELHLKHSDGGNIAFCDGHVAWIEKKRFLKIMDEKSDWFLPSR